MNHVWDHIKNLGETLGSLQFSLSLEVHSV